MGVPQPLSCCSWSMFWFCLYLPSPSYPPWAFFTLSFSLGTHCSFCRNPPAFVPSKQYPIFSPPFLQENEHILHPVCNLALQTLLSSYHKDPTYCVWSKQWPGSWTLPGAGLQPSSELHQHCGPGQILWLPGSFIPIHIIEITRPCALLTEKKKKKKFLECISLHPQLGNLYNNRLNYLNLIC